jgi:ribosomal protein S18 acetylase RimI-like enzyme
MLEIRKAHNKDAPIIALLGRITFTETFGHLFRDKNDLMDYYDNTFSVEKINQSIKKPENVFWLAFVNKLPVGYAKLKLNSKSEFIHSDSICQLQKIYVLNDFLSMKIGSELQTELFSEAKKSGFKHIWLSVLKTNDRAIRFYKKYGFSKAGQHSFSIGKEDFDFIAMHKTLPG